MLFSNAYVSYLGIRFAQVLPQVRLPVLGLQRKQGEALGVLMVGEESPATIIATPQPRVKRSDTAESVPNCPEKSRVVS